MVKSRKTNAGSNPASSTLKIKGNYSGQNLSVKFVFGPLEPDEHLFFDVLRSMLEKEHSISFTSLGGVADHLFEAWREHLHSGLDEFFEQIKKTVTEGIRW